MPAPKNFRRLPSDFLLTASLLIVELVLLIATFSLIMLGRREARGRENLVQHMINTARMVSRREYFNSLHFAMQTAAGSVRGSITGSVRCSQKLDPPNVGFSNEYIRTQATTIVAKTAVAKARCSVVVIGSSEVTTTSPPSKLWTKSRIIARAIALDGPTGRGLIFQTNNVLTTKRTPVTIVSNL